MKNLPPPRKNQILQKNGICVVFILSPPKTPRNVALAKRIHPPPSMKKNRGWVGPKNLNLGADAPLLRPLFVCILAK